MANADDLDAATANAAMLRQMQRIKERRGDSPVSRFDKGLETLKPGEVAQEMVAGWEDLFKLANPTLLKRTISNAIHGRQQPERFVQHVENPAAAPLATVTDPSNLFGTSIAKAGISLAAAPLVTKILKGAGKDVAEKVAEKVVAPAAEAAAETVAKAAPRKREGALVNLNLRDMTPEEAVAAAQRGEHLVVGGEGTKGRYVGGPRDITSGQKLAANRTRMDKGLTSATREIEAAGEVVGDWYPSQQRGVAEIAEPYLQRRTGRGTALFSPQADPHGERGFLIQAHNRAARGEPLGIVKTRAQADEFAQALAEGRDINLAEKTGTYGTLSDPTTPPSIFGTNDFRQAQFHGYTEPSGKKQTSGLKPAQHAFLDAETLLLTDRANRKALGGRTDWTGPMAQEVPWIIEKANALQKNNPGRYPRTKEGRLAAIRDASKTGEDFNPEFAVGATYERVPSVSSGHDPAVAGMSFADRLAYSQQAPWTREGRDVIYSGGGFLQRPTTQGVGIWEGKTNPNFIAQPMGDLISGANRQVAGGPRVKLGRELDPGMHRALAFSENLRGLVDAQDAAAYHLPMIQSTRKPSTKTHALLQHDTPLSEAETRALAEVLPPGYTPTPSPRGTMLMQWAKPSSGKESVAKDVAAMQDTIAQGQLPLERAGMEGALIPVLQRQTSKGGVPITPAQGIATRRFLRRAAQTPEATVQGVSESEGVRRAIEGVIARDEARAAQGAPMRADIQKTRKFLAEADWGKAVDLIRKGATPAAAVAALGYSLSGMAADEQKALSKVLRGDKPKSKPPRERPRDVPMIGVRG